MTKEKILIVNECPLFESIQFTWLVHVKDKSFYITATEGKQFTVDWGDGSDRETMTVTEFERPEHVYSAENEYTVTISGTTADCLLIAIDLRRNNVTNVDVSRCKSLQELDCSGNYIASLNLRANKALKQLNCSENDLTTLNVSANTALEILSCYKNKLRVLDLSANTALESLTCYFNKLTKLDLNATTRIVCVDCSYNNLTELDLKANKSISELDCSGNDLTKLDLRTKFMRELDCSCNKLTTIDVSRNRSLWYLGCNSNKLTTLDISANLMLQKLKCSCNKLITLDISANRDLKGLLCDNNCIAYQDIYKILTTRRRMCKEIDEQSPIPKKVTVGESCSLIPNRICGRTTLYRVKKGDVFAPKSDYNIESGAITFHKPGHYEIIMSVSGVSQDDMNPDTKEERELYDELTAKFIVEK